jgi:CheY-like chemotaxis protein
LNDDQPRGARRPVALVCPEQRLRLVLRLALEGAGYAVLDWSNLPGETTTAEPADGHAPAADPDGRSNLPAAVAAGSHLSAAVAAAEPGVLVVDLDSAALRPPAVVARLAAWGVDPATPLLFISVYPAERQNGRHGAPTEYLQPPFAPQEFLRRLARLLARAEAPRDPRPALPSEAAE